MLSVVITINAYGEIMGEPKVYSRGLVLSPTETKAGFLEVVTQIARDAIEKSPHNPKNAHNHSKNSKNSKFEIDKLQIDLRSELHRYIDDRMHRHPLLEVILMEYTGKPTAVVLGA
jgi:hypothetical protein